MKILLTGHTVPQSGVWGMGLSMSRPIYNLGLNLKKFGHDVKLLVRDDFIPKESWIETVHAPKFSWIPYPLYLSKKLGVEKADVYHSDYVTTGAPFIWNKKKPCIVSVHDVIPFSYRLEDLRLKDIVITAWYRYCFRYIRKADGLLFFTNWARNEAIKLGLNPNKLYVAYHGFETDIYYPVKKENSDIIKIGYLGNMDGRKNAILLVETFKKLKELYGKKIELHMVGDGKNLDLFKSMNIDGATFYGRVTDKILLNKFYNSLDIFVFPSLNEGFGRPLGEALHCGLPIVACNASTSPEILGKSGVLVDPTIEGMVNGVKPLIEDETLRKKFSNLSLERAKIFTYENHAKRMLEIYRLVIEERK